MAIRIAHGLTPALSGAAGFLTNADERADRRGAVAAGAANQSFALAQRKREFAFDAALAIADRQQKGLPGGGQPSGNPNAAADGARQAKLDKAAANQADTDRANQELKDAGYTSALGGPQPESSGGSGGAGGPSDPVQQGQPQQGQPAGVPAGGMAGFPMLRSSGRSTGSSSRRGTGGGRQGPEAQTGGYDDDNSMASLLRAKMSKQNLTPEGQRIAGDLTGKLRAIETQKDQMTTEQYGGMLNKWLEDYKGSGIEAFEKQKQDIDGQLRFRYKDLGTGVGAVMQPDGTIKPFEVDPAKVAASKDAKNYDSNHVKTAAERMGDNKSYAKLEQDAIAALTDERQEAIKNDKGDPLTFDASSLDEAEIADRVRTMAEKQEQDAIRSMSIRSRALGGNAQMQGQPGQPGQQQGPAAQPWSEVRQPTWADVMGGRSADPSMAPGQPINPSERFADPVRQLSYAEMMGGVPADPSMAAGQPLRLPYSLQQPQPGSQSPAQLSEQSPGQPKPMATEADVAAAEADGWQIPMKPPEGGMAGYAERAEKQKLNRSPQETAARESIGMSIESRRNTGDAEISQQYDSLAKSLQSKGREMTPEQFIDPWAVSAASKSGQKDPIGYAMKTANEALESGKPHISTISSMERNTHDQNGVQRFVGSPEQVQAQADKLPINTFYYDSDGYLRQRLPEKAKKKEPVVITDADRRASERILGRDFGRP